MHQLLPYHVLQQKKPWATDDQIMHHLRANPTMPMNQSRKLLHTGYKRLMNAKAKLKVPSTDADIRRFHVSNPTATHRSIKKTLRVGIHRFRNVIASASVSGSPSAP
jgi:hypothetical protein